MSATPNTPASITTPSGVETCIGVLEFDDRAWSAATAGVC
jgi:hypothetical protein